MNNPPPFQVRDQSRNDIDHLNLLSIFHFVGAGLAVLGILFLLGHFTLMYTVFHNPRMFQNSRGTPPPPELFMFFTVAYMIGGLWFVVSAVLNLMSGFYLRARQQRTFSLVVAAVNCLHMPLGTILGVFTIVVLSRESVRQLYETGSASP